MWFSKDCSDEGTPDGQRLKKFGIKLAVVDVGGPRGGGGGDFLEGQLVDALLQVNHALAEGPKEPLDLGEHPGQIRQDDGGRLVVGFDGLGVVSQVSREGVEEGGKVPVFAVGSFPALLQEGLEGEAGQETVDLDLSGLVLLLS